MYQITAYSFKKARVLGVIIKPSTRKNKKIDIFKKDGTFICAIGDINYNDYPTYIDKLGQDYADKRRVLYRIRHARYRDIFGTPSFYADKILW